MPRKAAALHDTILAIQRSPDPRIQNIGNICAGLELNYSQLSTAVAEAEMHDTVMPAEVEQALRVFQTQLAHIRGKNRHDVSIRKHPEEAVPADSAEPELARFSEEQ